MNSYLDAIGDFVRKWNRLVFFKDYEAIYQDTNSYSLLSQDEIEVCKKKLAMNCEASDNVEVCLLAACFSLLFTRYIMRAIDMNIGASKPVLAFVTKKGYWLYRVALKLSSYIETMFGENVAQKCYGFWKDEVIVRSDRYFTKTLNWEALEEKRIYLVDDIIHTGESIDQFVRSIKMGVDIERYIVFAAHREYQTAIDREGFEINKVVCNTVLDFDQLGELSIAQVKMFQALGVPYAIDLPVVTIRDDGGEKERDTFFSTGRLTRAEFDKVSKRCAERGWIKTEGSFISGLPSSYCCFALVSDDIVEKYRNLIQSLVVVCNYRQNAGEVDVTIVPFAILRSIELDELYALFQEAYRGSEYAEQVKKYLDREDWEERINILVTLLYRSLVFYLSVYVLERFNDVLSDVECQIKLELDTSHLNEHWCERFVQEIDQFLPATGFSPTLHLLSQMDDVELSSEYYDTKREFDTVAAERNIYFDMYQFFVGARDGKKARHYDFCSIERLEGIMAKQRGMKIDDIEFRNDFACAVLQLLNQSAISNMVQFDYLTGYVYRGFRSGENCSLILPFNTPAVFCAVYAYYECVLRTESAIESGPLYSFKLNYGEFRRRILELIRDSRLKAILDDQESSQMLDYYQECENPLELIRNKRYIVEEMRRQDTDNAMMADALQRAVYQMEFR